MNSFTLIAIGNVARDPELKVKGETTYARLCLIGNDYAGLDEDGAGRGITTSIWFVAFGALGEAIGRNARKGDQLILEARVCAADWTDKKGERRYEYSYIVKWIRFCEPRKVRYDDPAAAHLDVNQLGAW